MADPVAQERIGDEALSGELDDDGRMSDDGEPTGQCPSCAGA
jgi:hypothetical protein